MVRPRSIRSSLVIGPLAVALGACGGGGSGSDGDGASGLPPTSGSVGPIDGVWETACLPAAGMALSRRVVLSVTAEAFVRTDTEYSDTQCVEALQTLEARGRFVERPLEDGREPVDGIPLDLEISSLELTPRLSQVSADYNAIGLCGITDWAPGEPEDAIAGCPALVERGIVDDSSVPQTEHNRYFTDSLGTEEESDDILYLGALDGPSTESERPELVDREIGLSRRADG